MIECECLGMLPVMISFTGRALVSKISAVQHHSTEDFLCLEILWVYGRSRTLLLYWIYFSGKVVGSSSVAIIAPEGRKEGEFSLWLQTVGPNHISSECCSNSISSVIIQKMQVSAIVRGYSLRNRCIIQKTCAGTWIKTLPQLWIMIANRSVLPSRCHLPSEVTVRFWLSHVHY